MPEPTPTVTASDRAIARKWYRTGRGIYIGDVTDMMAEIAAAREAWGVPREAVAGLVEAAERMVTCRPTENLATLFALRAALEHVQGGGA